MQQINKLFNNRKLRAAWEKDTWWVSVIDVIAALRDTDYDTARNYWKQLKYRMGRVANSINSSELVRAKPEKRATAKQCQRESFINQHARRAKAASMSSAGNTFVSHQLKLRKRN